MPTECDGFVCDGCDHVEEDAPESPLYQCGSCGTSFTREGSYDNDSNRCPDCRKFAAKEAEFGCPSCTAAGMSSTTVYKCDRCGTVHAKQSEAEACEKEDDVPADVKARKAAADEAARKDAMRRHEEEAIAEVQSITADEVVAYISDVLENNKHWVSPGGRPGLSLNHHVLCALLDVLSVNKEMLAVQLEAHKDVYVKRVA